MRSANSSIQRFNDSTIIIANRQRTKKINARLLKQITGMLLAELKVENAELEINLVAAREMALINETFLKHEGSTDVITFDYAEKVARASRLRKKSLKRQIRKRAASAILSGELFICVDEAVLQARKFKTSWQPEIVRYIVHGVLHLLGHGDLKPGLRRKMKLEENRLLRGLSQKFSLAQIARRSKISA
jgi:probable rRNA maturation factor